MFEQAEKCAQTLDIVVSVNPDPITLINVLDHI